MRRSRREDGGEQKMMRMKEEEDEDEGEDEDIQELYFVCPRYSGCISGGKTRKSRGNSPTQNTVNISFI